MDCSFPASNENALTVYRDPDLLVDIVSFSTSHPVRLCDTGLCRHKDTSVCVLRGGDGNIVNGRCEHFELIDDSRENIEEIILIAINGTVRSKAFK